MNSKNRERLCRSGLLAMSLMLVLALVACGNDTGVQDTQNAAQVSEQTNASGSVETTGHLMEQQQPESIELQTKYAVLRCSEVYSDVLHHQEVISGNVAMELFSMQVNDSARELFRIYFGDEATGTVAGYLTADGVEVPVTYTICQYNDDEFADEDDRSLYFETMECFGQIMEGLQSSAGFQIEKQVTPVDNIEAKLSYWSFQLPETMEYEEAEYDGRYQAVFYGNVAGERIKLYTIYLGRPSVETVLGTYNVNGEDKLLSVESYEIVPGENWTNEEKSSAYAMMATVNDVLQVIMSNGNFSTEQPEG